MIAATNNAAFLKALTQFDGSAGNGKLREAHGWNKTMSVAVKPNLMKYAGFGSRKPFLEHLEDAVAGKSDVARVRVIPHDPIVRTVLFPLVFEVVDSLHPAQQLVLDGPLVFFSHSGSILLAIDSEGITAVQGLLGSSIFSLIYIPGWRFIFVSIHTLVL